MSKVMIITGASSGFGRLAAQIAAAVGYRVVVTARRAERLEELVREIEAAGGQATAVAGDITSEDDQQRIIDTALERYGQIDVLVNNAGMPLQKNYADSSLADLRGQWNTNVTSIITLTKRALPALMDAKGVVINIGSIAGHFSLPGWGLYYPTKVAVASLSDAMRRELRPLGVKVCLVEPGPFRTEFGERAGTADLGGFAPESVARAIVRLAERPRRRVILPIWMHPLALIFGALVHLIPDVVDVVCWAMIKRQMQEQQPA